MRIDTNWFASAVGFAAVLCLIDAPLAKDRDRAAPADPREAFLRLIDRPRVPLSPEVKVERSDAAIVREHFTIAAEDGDDTVWDIMRRIDYLETRGDVDAARIGVTGISKGGMETYLAAAVDPRIAAAVPVIGVQSFRWALDHDGWQSRAGTFQAALDAAAVEAGVKVVDAAFVRRFYDRVVPGIYADFDAPAMLPLVAPRPLLAINGDSDARTPLAGVQECASAAERAYRAAHAQDRFVLHIQPNTGHAFTPRAEQAALDWFVRWLKPRA
jgi:fermentation-respiration switch protein FrsA (DUF1100 family)